MAEKSAGPIHQYPIRIMIFATLVPDAGGPTPPTAAFGTPLLAAKSSGLGRLFGWSLGARCLGLGGSFGRRLGARFDCHLGSRLAAKTNLLG